MIRRTALAERTRSSRALQTGPGGEPRLAAIRERFFAPGGRPEGARYRGVPFLGLANEPWVDDLILAAAFAEVWLAKEGHSGAVGLNLLTKIQLPTLPTLLGAMLAGATLFFGLRHTHFHTALPLHPAGYPLALSFAMNYFWFSFLVSWLIKVAVLRFGGREAHRMTTRLMLGVLLGDYVTGSVWSLLGLALQMPLYKTFI